MSDDPLEQKLAELEIERERLDEMERILDEQPVGSAGRHDAVEHVFGQAIRVNELARQVDVLEER